MLCCTLLLFLPQHLFLKHFDLLCSTNKLAFALKLGLFTTIVIEQEYQCKTSNQYIMYIEKHPRPTLRVVQIHVHKTWLTTWVRRVLAQLKFDVRYEECKRLQCCTGVCSVNCGVCVQRAKVHSRTSLSLFYH